MKQKSNALIIVLVVVGLLVVGVGIFVFLSRGEKQNTVQLTTNITSERETEEKSTVEKEGIENNKSTIIVDLVDVSGGDSTGKGYVLRENGLLRHRVVANLPDLTNNRSYEGWLVQQTPILKFFSTGVMKKKTDGNYELSFESAPEYVGYDFVVITSETVVDATPEKHILEGTAR